MEAALRFLTAETPQWVEKNGCYSCHNNGDGARALYAARARGLAVSNAALEGTNAWLRRPGEWGLVRGAPVAGSANLGRIQFSAALAEALRADAVAVGPWKAEAARELLSAQAADGSFPVDTGGLPGAPATYGTALATVIARNTLKALGGPVERVARAEAWIARARPANNLDAAALLWGNAGRADCRERLLAAQSSDGGWGPQARAPSEVFDTAVAVIALMAAKGPAGSIERGRGFLVKMQEADGGWPETTRPAGGVSYAERVSTAAWATMALMAR